MFLWRHFRTHHSDNAGLLLELDDVGHIAGDAAAAWTGHVVVEVEGLLGSQRREEEEGGKEGEKGLCDLSKRILEKIKNLTKNSAFILFLRLQRERERSWSVQNELKLFSDEYWKKNIWSCTRKLIGKCWGSFLVMNIQTYFNLNLNLKKIRLCKSNFKGQKALKNWF